MTLTLEIGANLRYVGLWALGVVTLAWLVKEWWVVAVFKGKR